ncbi:MAG TPA: N-acetyltransferase [Dehalococcoidia bacterium]|jgi:amino-acid N-acetyltransferase|nr:N-acetyltransferase [Dehalococcoidia bacterium]
MAAKAVKKEKTLVVEKAKISDAPQIHKLANHFAQKGVMLPRALSEIYENIRDFFVIRDGEKVIAAVALHVYWSDLAEVRGLAVAEEKQNQRLGAKLIEACINEARELGIPQAFCLTYRASFFERQGFKRVDKAELPRKIWSECYRCPKFPDCDEVAMIYRC